jgi:predicted transcriptional regulator
MITTSQLRAGRALAGLSIKDLAAATGVSEPDIEAAEVSRPHADPDMIARLKTALESKGIVFIAAGEGDTAAGPGVRLRSASHDEGIRPQDLNSTNDD